MIRKQPMERSVKQSVSFAACSVTIKTLLWVR
jgi:hypothetical protein